MKPGPYVVAMLLNGRPRWLRRKSAITLDCDFVADLAEATKFASRFPAEAFRSQERADAVMPLALAEAVA